MLLASRGTFINVLISYVSYVPLLLQDYPSIGHLVRKITEHKIQPIFAVTKEVFSTYEVCFSTVIQHIVLRAKKKILSVSSIRLKFIAPIVWVSLCLYSTVIRQSGSHFLAVVASLLAKQFNVIGLLTQIYPSRSGRKVVLKFALPQDPGGGSSELRLNCL